MATNYRPLSAKMRLFAEEYTVDLNAAAAARRAGYSETTADAKAHEWLDRPDVREIINAKMKERSGKVGLSAETVLEDIRRIARKAEEKGQYQVALKAHELEGKHLKLFSDQINVTGTMTLEALVVAAAKKPDEGE